ncbi:MAG TPA: histidine kinase [Gammaproteobacteria bacterium]|nr:histidine kinase [Gammaproteobacteria bacterium]
MPSLFTRLPPMRSLNRSLLLIGVTLLLWTFDLAWELALTVGMDTAEGVDRWRQVIGPRVMEHVLLLPVLILCYMASMQVSRYVSHTLLAGLAHLALSLVFASVPRVALFVGFYVVAGSINAGGSHYGDFWQAVFAPMPWLSALLVNFVVYLLGLFILLGINTRLDLENERIRASELYARWLNARLDTLRGQLNPHFLFNSLHTISSLLLVDPRRADKLLADFSDVLRISLREGQREFASVREELDYARRYLAIEETRFEDRLETRFRIDEASLGGRVPSLILQPLIENAIKYGISNSAGSNCVIVETKRGGDTLVLEVSNDFRADASPVSPDRKNGIGLTNVRERLVAIYGGDFTLSSQALPGNRWSTRISVPYQEVTGG